jgi:hypothetical protein
VGTKVKEENQSAFTTTMAQLHNDAELRAALMADPRLAPVLSNQGKYRTQVLVAEVCTNAAGAAAVTATSTTKKDAPETEGGAAARGMGMILKRFGFRADAGEYFYPASTVKLMGAAAALLKLQQIAHQHSRSYVDDDDATATEMSFSTSRRRHFRLDLDTPLLFEPRGVVASIADSRAKTDRALR